jgi:uncharacterized protein (DUF433 family)
VLNYLERFIRDPQICGGQPRFKGTRVLLRSVLAGLAAGETTEAILSGYPSLKPADIQAAIAFAAASTRRRPPRSGSSAFLIRRRPYELSL